LCCVVLCCVVSCCVGLRCAVLCPVVLHLTTKSVSHGMLQNNRVALYNRPSACCEAGASVGGHCVSWCEKAQQRISHAHYELNKWYEYCAESTEWEHHFPVASVRSVAHSRQRLPGQTSSEGAGSY